MFHDNATYSNNNKNNHFVRLSVPVQAYKADVSLALQGKADSKGLESVAALVRSKVYY